MKLPAAVTYISYVRPKVSDGCIRFTCVMSNWKMGTITDLQSEYIRFSSYYRPQTKLRKGNVFTPVCQDEVYTPLGRHPPGRHPLPDGHCIRLECILVHFQSVLIHPVAYTLLAVCFPSGSRCLAFWLPQSGVRCLASWLPPSGVGCLDSWLPPSGCRVLSLFVTTIKV